MSALLVLSLPALTRQEGQQAARHELSKQPYQQARPAWWSRPLHWLLHQLDRLWTSAAQHTGGSAALAVLILLVLALAALLVWRVGPTARSKGRRGFALSLDQETTADQHRAAARRHAGQQQWAEAVREQLRAVSRDLEDRALLDRRAGRTAYELATEGGRALPSVAPLLREGADVFASIWYGSASATEADHQRLVAIDAAVQRARPARTPDVVST
jgi:hypothetical protein